MVRQSIEDLLEKAASVPKEKVELKQKELEEMQSELKKHKKTLFAFHGKATEKRARVKKEKQSHMKDAQLWFNCVKSAELGRRILSSSGHAQNAIELYALLAFTVCI